MDFSNLKVLVVGEICLDIIEQGESNRLSPECPVPVILNPSKTYSLGMAGNTALNLKTLGADVYINTWLRVDEYGDKIQELLDKNGIKRKYKEYKTKKANSNIIKNRIFANNHQVARIDTEPTQIVEKNLLKVMEESTDIYNTNEFDLIIISDYNKGFITKESWSIMRPILENYNKGNFFVDTKKLNILDFYEGMHIFPNTKEMDALLEHNNCKTRTELRKELDIDFIVETASENGSFLYKDDGKMYHCPVFNSNVVDICGAGDTFIAAFALYYTKYNNKKAALGFANYCCSKVIQRQGTTPILISEVKDFHDYKGV